MFHYSESQILMPGFLEQILSITSGMGNLALHGIYLGLYYRRNFLWVSALLFLIDINFIWLLFFSIYLFWDYFNRWKNFL